MSDLWTSTLQRAHAEQSHRRLMTHLSLNPPCPPALPARTLPPDSHLNPGRGTHNAFSLSFFPAILWPTYPTNLQSSPALHRAFSILQEQTFSIFQFLPIQLLQLP